MREYPTEIQDVIQGVRMKKRTYVHVLISALVFLFTAAANADDVSGLLDPDQELIAGLESPTYSVSLKKVDQDSNDMMDSMLVDRAKGETVPKIVKQEQDDGMVIVLKSSKRVPKRKS